MKIEKELEWFITHNQDTKYQKEEVFKTWKQWNSMKGVHNYDFPVNEEFGYNYIDATKSEIKQANKNCEEFCISCKDLPNNIWNTTTNGYVGSRYKKPTNAEIVKEIKEEVQKLMIKEIELNNNKSNECYFLEENHNSYHNKIAEWKNILGEESKELNEWLQETLFDFYYENWNECIRETDEYKDGIKEFINDDGEISEEGYEWEELFNENFNIQFYIVDDIIKFIKEN